MATLTNPPARVWICSPFDPLPGEGGRPLRYWLLARAVVAAGGEVVWWSSDFHHVRKAKRSLPAVYEAEGFSVRLVPTPPYATNVGLSRWRSHAAFARRFEAMAREAVAAGTVGRPDCIVVSQPPLGLFDAAARLRSTFGCRVALDVQDAWPETFYQLLPGPLRWLAPAILAPLHSIANRAYRTADQVSVVAEAYAPLVRRARAGEPAVFRLGIGLPALPSRAASPGPLRLAYIGSLGVSYDIPTMLAAVLALSADGPPVSLDIAGDGVRRKEVEKAAAASGGAIRFHGYVDDAAMRQMLAGCDVGIVPMFGRSWVAVPNKVADYAAAGLAIVNGLTGETSRLLAEYEAGIDYRAGSRASLEAAIRRYAADRGLVARHAEAARRMAEAIFDAASIYPAMTRWLS
jgi:glycosyltransferase involved in cell wall biosynthesis